MTTKLTKPVTRETSVMIQGRELILTIKPNGTITFREKGRQMDGVDVSIEACYHLGIKQAVAAAKGPSTVSRKR